MVDRDFLVSREAGIHEVRHSDCRIFYPCGWDGFGLSSDLKGVLAFSVVVAGVLVLLSSFTLVLLVAGHATAMAFVLTEAALKWSLAATVALSEKW